MWNVVLKANLGEYTLLVGSPPQSWDIDEYVVVGDEQEVRAEEFLLGEK